MMTSQQLCSAVLPCAYRVRFRRTLALALLAFTSLAAFAVDVAPSPFVKAQFFDASGNPLAGGCITTYTTGTSTPLATYTDSTGTAQNTNPVILDSAGRANIWLSASTYRFVAKSTGGTQCASGTQQWDISGISNRGLLTFTQAVILNPVAAANQTIVGPLTANYFVGASAHTTSTGVRVAILASVTTLDTAANPPTITTVQPAGASQNYNIPDPLQGGNFVINPSGNSGTSNVLDCTLTGLTCKRYGLAIFPGGGCNNTTAGLGWDNFGTNTPDAICVTGTNVQKGVMAMRSAATKYQENTGTGTAGTCTVTYPSATSAGDFLVGYTILDSTRTVTGVTDGTNAYTAATTVTSGVYRLSVYYFNGSSTAMAAASTLTFTYSAAANAACGFMAYKDMKTAGALDVSATNTGSGTAVTTGTTAGTAQNTELILSFVGSASNPTVAFQSGTNGHTTVAQSTNVTGSSEGFIQQATSTQAGTFTLGAANTWLSAIVAFKANVASSVVAQQTSFVPSTFVSGLNLNADIMWQAPSAPTGTSTAVLGAQVICAAAGSTDDPAFNTASTSAITVPSSVANTLGLTTLSNITKTGCSTQNLIHYQLIRQRYNASDNYEGYVYVNVGSFYLGIN